MGKDNMWKNLKSSLGRSSSSQSSSTSQPQLCSYCSQISFEALRTPYKHEIDEMLSGKVAGQGGLSLTGPKEGKAVEKVLLGPLSRIREDSSTCKLCALFIHIISRQGAVYNMDQTLDAENIIFRADPVASYGYISGASWKQDDAVWVPRRLILRAYHAENLDAVIASLDHVMQPCDIETALFISGISVPEETNIYKGKPESVMQFSGRYRPLVMDLELVKKWLRICHEEHGTSCKLTVDQEDDSHFEYIRFIDVKRMCICELKNVKVSETNFVALSYVWGAVQPYKLEDATKSTLELPNSLKKLDLPQTIADALYLCSLLDIEYLWVDALCIIQDNVEDQTYQVGKMADIYSAASLTVVAAFGNDSNAGLPGLRPGTRTYEQRSVIVRATGDGYPGMGLMTTVKSLPQHWDEYFSLGLEDVDFSKWNTRAWTMQERALSRRNLIFTKEQVLWTCPRAYLCEESDFEVPKARFRHFSQQTVNNLGINASKSLEDSSSSKALWDYYRYVVQRYTRRDITYEGDVFDAFQAVIVGLERTSAERFLWGLPLSRFDLAISWDTFHGLKRRTALSKLPMTSLKRNIVFPSWSWMGWVGEAHCSVGDDRLETERQDIICYTHRSNPLRFLPVRNTHEDDSNQEVIDSDSPGHVAERHVAQQLPSLTADKLGLFPDDYLLFFWADSAFFTVESRKHALKALKSFSDYAEDTRTEIQNDQGETIGSVCKMPPKASDLEDDADTTKREFVAIARRAIPEIPDYPQTILALQIERKSGVAYRVNIGEIEEAAWQAANPKRSLIVLA